jgi:membrane protein implicated in regulation of membrane protease activity
MDWLTPELLWFLIGLVLIILEFGIPGVITIFFGIGAWLVSLLCLLFNIPLNLQIIVFIIGSIIPLILLRKWFKQLLEGRSAVGPVDLDELEEFLGKKVVVTEEITPERRGRVEFRGSTWKAEAYETIAVGTTVEIVDKNNITLIVKSL